VPASIARLAVALALVAVAATWGLADEGSGARAAPPRTELGLQLAAGVGTHGLDTTVDPASAFRQAAQRDLPFIDLVQASSPTGADVELGLRLWLPLAWRGARPWLAAGGSLPAARARGRHDAELLTDTVVPQPGEDPVPGLVASPEIGVAADWRASFDAGLEWTPAPRFALGPFLGVEAQRFVVDARGIALAVDGRPLVTTRWRFDEADVAWGLRVGLSLRYRVTSRIDLDGAFAYTEYLSDHDFSIGSVGLAPLDPVPLSLDPGGVLRAQIGALVRLGLPDRLPSGGTEPEDSDVP